MRNKLKQFFKLIFPLTAILGLVLFSNFPKRVSLAQGPSVTKDIGTLSGTNFTPISRFTIGDEGYVQIKIRGEEPSHGTKKADIVLDLDLSGSMSTGWYPDLDGDPKKYESAKQSLSDFIDKGNPDYERMALVTFTVLGLPCDRHIFLEEELTFDYGAVKATLDSLTTPDGGTPLIQSVDRCIQEHIDHGRSQADKFIVVATDGEQNCDYTWREEDNERREAEKQRVIDELNAQGITVYAAGVSPYTMEGDPIEIDTIIDICNATGGKYYFAATEDDLDEIFAEIRREIDLTRRISIEDHLNSPYFKFRGDESGIKVHSTGGPTEGWDLTVEDDVISGDVGELRAGEELTVWIPVTVGGDITSGCEYDVSVDRPPNEQNRVYYKGLDEQVMMELIIPDVTVDVCAPLPTLTPTPTITPTPTPTPTPSPTSAPTPTPFDAWLNVVDGEAYSAGHLEVKVPSNRYLVEDSSMAEARIGGVAIANGYFGGLSSERLSRRGWSMSTYQVEFPASLTSYSNLQEKYHYNQAEILDRLSSVEDGGVYRVDSLTINGPADLPNASDNKSVVIFVDQGLTINGDFIVPPLLANDSDLGTISGFRQRFDPSMLFIVQGDVHINPAVEVVYGVYLVNGEIYTGNSDNRLYLFGALMSLSDKEIHFQRDLGQDNDALPGETVVSMPKYYFTLGEVIGDVSTTWREAVAD